MESDKVLNVHYFRGTQLQIPRWLWGRKIIHHHDYSTHSPHSDCILDDCITCFMWYWFISKYPLERWLFNYLKTETVDATWHKIFIYAITSHTSWPCMTSTMFYILSQWHGVFLSSGQMLEDNDACWFILTTFITDNQQTACCAVWTASVMADTSLYCIDTISMPDTFYFDA